MSSHAALLHNMRRYRNANRAYEVDRAMWETACAECREMKGKSTTLMVPAELRRAELHNQMRASERSKDIAANLLSLSLFDLIGLDVDDMNPSDESLDKILKASLRVSQL